ncbi:MAG: hypothetical protein DK304_000925, partial [Chloroflexi bacterium]
FAIDVQVHAAPPISGTDNPYALTYSTRANHESMLYEN